MSQTIWEAVDVFRQAVSKGVIGELNFPTSLDAGRRVLKAVSNPDVSVSELAKIVVAEPLLSAKVIRLANSVALNPGNQTVVDVRQAVMRVGVDPIKVLAMVLIMDQLRHSQRHSGCRDLADRLWERSVHVAALSYVLARKLTTLNADEAMFAGIVTDLGRFYLLSRVADHPVLLEDVVVLAETISDLAADATRMVLDKLNQPTSVVDAVLDSRHFSGSMPPSTLSDVLFIARAVSPCANPFEELDSRLPSSVEVVGELGLDQGMVAEVIAASGEEIYSIVIALES